VKLHFESNLEYQHDAIEAVCDLFRGQEICRTEFTVTEADVGQLTMSFAESNLGIGNRLTLLDDEILENLNDVQLKNGLTQSSVLDSADFTIEMETGTGKTYVYLRTIFELNKRFGFTKFVIVVPSVAIKEGVYKTLQMTEDHFAALYAGVPLNYFRYDSSKLGEVRNFATSPQIQVMVTTVGAINKQDVNNLYKDSEKTGGEKPIDLIRATSPILIVDEPQSVDGGLQGRGKEALGAMAPLCSLRYSATHANKHHMVYRLDAVDAYEQRLVKQIEVASATVEDAFNKPFLRFIAPVFSGKSVVGAKVEVDVQGPHGVRRREVVVQDGDDLEQTTGREVYRDCRVGEIRAAKGRELLELRVPSDERFLEPGQAFGDVDAMAVQREMIRRTIREHLDKEKRLRPDGIKVLSLFFIDAVDKYRSYNEEGQPVKGEYARIFEEEYQRLAHHPDYQTLFGEVDLSANVREVHDGYFSIDKQGGWTDTSEGNQSGRDNAERAYNLIMKEKEKLLSFSTPLKFIFSHSALREGWDNPNVFQICSLREMRSERERRQTIGRGLRLCVNQEGERQRGFEINTLTVVATESYEAFAEGLQREIEADTGIRFGLVEKHEFANIAVLAGNEPPTILGAAKSEVLWEHLRSAGYIDGKGRVQDDLRTALKQETLAVPDEFTTQLPQIVNLLRKLAGRLEIKNADERRTVRPRKGVLLSPEFKALWDRIKHKTTYRVHFDNEKLIQECVRALRDAPPITKTRLHWRKAGIAIGQGGVEATELSGATTVVLDELDVILPDLLSELQDRTQLTRRSIMRIVSGSTRLKDFTRNPQQFVDLASEVISRSKRMAVVDGIRYQRLGDEQYYAQELFEEVELTGYLKNILSDAKKSVYEDVVYDFGVEENFATDLEHNDAVKVYAKLPGWFTVPTPLGSYNPDWAVVVDIDGEERLYFVVETKASLFTDDLRDTESAKIECGKAHFRALANGESPAHYIVARSLDDVMANAFQTGN
jgi:type III restriction enzyme